jgi:DNA-binding XRE family transcriptional regulator
MTLAKRRQGKQKPIGMREASRMDYSPQKIGKALHARRVTSGLSLTDLARQLGVSERTVANWENGKAPLAACRIFSWVFENHDYDEIWQIRALMAEATLRDIHVAMTEYRSARNTTD